MPSTRELARETAFQMLMDGTKPSVQKVREQLGRGSDKTILDGLNEFWAELGQLIQDWRTYPAIPNELATAMNEWWHQAMKQAHQSLEGDRKEMASVIGEAQAKQAVAEVERDQSSKRIDDLSNENDDLNSQINVLSQKYQNQLSTVATLTSENKAMMAEMEKLSQQIALLETNHKDDLKLAYERSQFTENHLTQQMDGWKTQAENNQATLIAKEKEWQQSDKKRLAKNESLYSQLNKALELQQQVKQENLGLLKTAEEQKQQLILREKNAKKGATIFEKRITDKDTRIESLAGEISELKSKLSAFEAKESTWAISQNKFDQKFNQLLETLKTSE